MTTQLPNDSKKWLLALDNKLTGKRGIMGMLELLPKAAERIGRGIYEMSALFPSSIASRAARFVVDEGTYDEVMAHHGPEIGGRS